MPFDADDEILQDFLIEAGEIIETLNEELVELEQRPNDTDLLNSVFRSFHTIKGGAGFLALDPLVELCHRAEDVFNLLRNGDLQVDAAIMDVMLPVLDSLNEMFDSLRAATEPENADPALLAALDGILKGDAAPVEPVASAPADASQEDVTDEEFEQLLDALDEPGASAPAASSSGSDDITEDEFENLLDQLHGKGQFKSEGISNTENPSAAEPEQKVTADKKLSAVGIHGSFVPINGITRSAYKVMETATRLDTEFNQVGTWVQKKDLEELETALKKLLNTHQWLALCGSIPAGIPGNFYASQIKMSKQLGVTTCLDASSEPLKLPVIGISANVSKPKRSSSVLPPASPKIMCFLSQPSQIK